MKFAYNFKELPDRFKISALVFLLCVLAGPGALAQAEKSGFIKTSDGIRIHYVEAGNGDPIVFIPGWRMPAWIWQKQIDGLSNKYRVIAVDPRSQGKSDKPNYGHLPETRARDYKQVVDQLGLKQPVLIGWSMGCGELLSYVEQFGEEGIRDLVLTGSPEGGGSICSKHVQEAGNGSIPTKGCPGIDEGPDGHYGRSASQLGRGYGFFERLRQDQSSNALCV